MTLDKIEITSTTFGNLNLKLLTDLLDEGIKFGIPFFNAILAKKPITFPTKIFGLFELNDVKLTYFDNILEAGVTPTFLPPPEEFFFKPMPKFWDFELEEEEEVFI